MRNPVERLLENNEECFSTWAQASEKYSKLLDQAAAILGKSDLEEAAPELAEIFKQMAAAQKSGAAFLLGQAAFNGQIKRDLALMSGRQPYNSLQVIDPQKAEGDELNKIQPDGIRSVIPATPSTVERIFGTEGLTAVRRAGQPDLPQRPNVAVEFEHLVKTEDEAVPH